MYLRILKMLAALCLLTTFWSVIRVADISIFECLVPVVLLFALPYVPPGREYGLPLKAFTLAILSVLALAMAGCISSFGSVDPDDHILKVVKLVGAFSLVIGLAYVLTSRKIFSASQTLYLLSASAFVASAVAIAQGQLGMLTSLMPRTDTAAGLEDWTRMTGLSEHPIEAGLVSSFGIVITLGLAIRGGRWILLLPVIAVDVYSMKFSASLTAVFAAFIAAVSVCIYVKSYKTLWTGLAVGSLAVILSLTLSSSGAGLLSSRLAALYQSQGNYQTVQYREMQLRKTIQLIGPGTLFVGNGYSIADLPLQMEVHNGLLASVFHFGVLGLLSQCLLIGFFVSRLWHEAPKELKGILLGSIIVFALSYLTGPPQARPSLWATLILLGAYLTLPKRQAAVREHLLSPRFPVQTSLNRLISGP